MRTVRVMCCRQWSVSEESKCQVWRRSDNLCLQLPKLESLETKENCLYTSIYLTRSKGAYKMPNISPTHYLRSHSPRRDRAHEYSWTLPTGCGVVVGTKSGTYDCHICARYMRRVSLVRKGIYSSTHFIHDTSHITWHAHSSQRIPQCSWR